MSALMAAYRRRKPPYAEDDPRAAQEPGGPNVGQQHKVGADPKPPRAFKRSRAQNDWLYGTGPDWNRANRRYV